MLAYAWIRSQYWNSLPLLHVVGSRIVEAVAGLPVAKSYQVTVEDDHMNKSRSKVHAELGSSQCNC